MSLRLETLLSCKDGVVELTAEILEPPASTESFTEEVRQRLASDQHRIMTDPAILDPHGLSVASGVKSRDPIAKELEGALASLGFGLVSGQKGADAPRSIFARFAQKSRRSQLFHWRCPYLRARDASSQLAELESSLIEEVEEGSLVETHEQAAGALINAARTYLHLLLSPGFSGLESLEDALLKLRGTAAGRLVLHPKAVRAIAAFCGASIQKEAPKSSWSADPEEEDPLYIRVEGGVIVQSDPEYRVVQFVRERRQALLSGYAQSVIRQSSLESKKG